LEASRGNKILVTNLSIAQILLKLTALGPNGWLLAFLTPLITIFLFEIKKLVAQQAAVRPNPKRKFLKGDSPRHQAVTIALAFPGTNGCYFGYLLSMLLFYFRLTLKP
jgi:hypothetical protein